MLMERKLIRILGRKEIPGRPLIYATTKLFLEVFDLKDLKDLPTPKEIEELSQSSLDQPQQRPLPEPDSSPEDPSGANPDAAETSAGDSPEGEASDGTETDGVQPEGTGEGKNP